MWAKPYYAKNLLDETFHLKHASSLSACVVLWFRSAACWSSTWAAAWRSTRSSWIRRCCWSWANWIKPRSSLTTSTWWEPYWLHHPNVNAVVMLVCRGAAVSTMLSLTSAMHLLLWKFFNVTIFNGFLLFIQGSEWNASNLEELQDCG